MQSVTCRASVALPECRGEHPVRAFPVLPRWRDEIRQPIVKLNRQEVDDAIGPQPRGRAAATGSAPVGRLVSGEHVTDATDAAVCTAAHGEPLEREGGPGAEAPASLSRSIRAEPPAAESRRGAGEKATSASRARPRPTGMGATVTPRKAAATRITRRKSHARTTRRAKAWAKLMAREGEEFHLSARTRLKTTSRGCLADRISENLAMLMRGVAHLAPLLAPLLLAVSHGGSSRQYRHQVSRLPQPPSLCPVARAFRSNDAQAEHQWQRVLTAARWKV